MKNRALTIYIGGDMEKDEKELSENPKEGLKQPQNTLYLDSYGQLNNILSPARIDLLRCLIKGQRNGGQKSVGEIAAHLKRKQEAISRDVHYLKNLKMLGMRKERQTVYVYTDFDSINIEIEP